MGNICEQQLKLNTSTYIDVVIIKFVNISFVYFCSVYSLVHITLYRYQVQNQTSGKCVNKLQKKWRVKGPLQPLHHQVQPQNMLKFTPITLNNASPQSRISVPGAMLVPVLTANVFAMNERKAVGKIYAWFCFNKSI